MKVVRLSASRTGRLYPQEIFLVLIFTRGWVDPRAMVRSEGILSLKNPVTPLGVDPGTVWLVAQRLNHHATPAPSDNLNLTEITYNGSNVLNMCVVKCVQKCSNVLIMCVVGVSHIWTIMCNFSQLLVINPWWWIICDPKHVGVIFNVCLLDCYITRF